LKKSEYTAKGAEKKKAQLRQPVSALLSAEREYQGKVWAAKLGLERIGEERKGGG